VSFAGFAADSAAQRPFTLARTELPPLYAQRCIADYEETTPVVCRFGPDRATSKVVLFGDSHAAQWFPAVSAIAEERGWQIATFIKSACPPAEISFVYPALARDYWECGVWRKQALAQIEGLEADLVLVTSSFAYDVESGEWGAGLARTFASLSRSGAKVLHLRDTPRPGFNVPACLAREEWLRWLRGRGDCTFRRDAAVHDGIYREELRAAASHRIASADLTEDICPDPVCQPMAGEHVVYRDSNHLASSYVETLAHRLAQELDRPGEDL
jgi:hypothetical protein